MFFLSHRRGYSPSPQRKSVRKIRPSPVEAIVSSPQMARMATDISAENKRNYFTICIFALAVILIIQLSLIFIPDISLNSDNYPFKSKINPTQLSMLSQTSSRGLSVFDNHTSQSDTVVVVGTNPKPSNDSLISNSVIDTDSDNDDDSNDDDSDIDLNEMNASPSVASPSDQMRNGTTDRRQRIFPNNNQKNDSTAPTPFDVKTSLKYYTTLITSNRLVWSETNYSEYCMPTAMSYLRSTTTHQSYLKVHDAMTMNNGTAVTLFLTSADSYKRKRRSIDDSVDAMMDHLCGRRYICAFSNGITIFSNKIETGCYNMVNTYLLTITCDLMHPEVIAWQKWLATQAGNESQFDEYLNNVRHLQQQMLGSEYRTSIGIRIFDVGFDPTIESNFNLKWPTYYHSYDETVSPEYFPTNDELMAITVSQLSDETDTGDYEFIGFQTTPEQKRFNSVAAPVCATTVVNNGEIFRHDPPPLPHTLHYARTQMESDEKILDIDVLPRPYHLAACAIVYPGGDKFGQMTDQIQQWIEFHRMQGFEHFYIYDHTWNDGYTEDEYSSDDDRIFFGANGDIYDAMVPYIKNKIVTYIDWRVPKTIQKWPRANLYYQHAQLHHCLKRFQYSADFFALMDVDEWMLPNWRFKVEDTWIINKQIREGNPQFLNTPNITHKQLIPYLKIQRREQKEVISENATVRDMIDYLHSKFDINYWETTRYIGSTCAPSKAPIFNDSDSVDNNDSDNDKQIINENIGCDNRFFTYLQRHRCLIFVNGLPKIIVNPMVVHTTWTHYIEIINQWLPFYADNEQLYYARKVRNGNVWWHLKKAGGIQKNVYQSDEPTTKEVTNNGGYSLMGSIVAVHMSNHWHSEVWWQRTYPISQFEVSSHSDGGASVLNYTFLDVYTHHSMRNGIVDSNIERFHSYLRENDSPIMDRPQIKALVSDDGSFCWDNDTIFRT